MFKRCRLCAIALIIVLLSAACSGEAPPTPEAPMVVQNIMSGSDDVSDEADMTPPTDTIPSDKQQTETLTEEKDYLQTEIDALNQKLADLTWLRDSYIAENAADLQTKLAECDAKMADINAQLQNLQNRMARNESDSKASGENEPETPSDAMPEETETPNESATESAPSPSDTVSGSIQSTSEETVPVS